MCSFCVLRNETDCILLRMEEVTRADLEKKLKEKFNPVYLEVEDQSSGCGANFSVIVVSEKFCGKSLLERHRLVNACLREELNLIHAFSQKSYTPEQWEKMKSQ